MFLIHTCVKPSRIHGMGVFAAEDIPAGTLIWIYNEKVDWRMSEDDLSRFPEPFQSRMRDYSYRLPSGDYVFCGDNAKFMNHSTDPNCDDPEGRYTVANRDIEAGEELTSDYTTFDLESAEKGAESLYEEADSAA